MDLEREHRIVLAAVTMMVAYYMSYRKRHRETLVAQWYLVHALLRGREGEGNGDYSPGRKRPRHLQVRPEYDSSQWAEMLRDSTLQDHKSRAAKLFRRRFRVPYRFFIEIVRLAKDAEWFTSEEHDASGREYIPVELKV